MRLEGKRTIVTGGAGGIGSAIAAGFAREAGRVLVADRDVNKAMAVADALGEGHSGIGVDVTAPDSIAAMVAAAEARMGGVDVLVNSAGVVLLKDVLAIEPDEWRRVIEVNLIGTFTCCLMVAKAMAAQGTGGSIVNIGSVAADRPSAGTTAYATSKGGVATLTRALAVDLAGRNIRVNAIAPGPVETGMARGAHRPAFRAAFKQMIPLHRYARADEVAPVAVFLASDEASFVTGEIIKVDGGYSGAGVMV